MTVHDLQITLTFVLRIMETKFILRIQKKDASDLDQDNISTRIKSWLDHLATRKTIGRQISIDQGQRKLINKDFS